MKNETINNHEFIKFQYENAVILFSTAKADLNFNKNTQEGLLNLEMIKKHYKLQDIGYLNQIHSDIIVSFDGNTNDGDALISDRTKTAIGVFTADCVPVILVDTKKGVIAAVHSGWKGTKALIVSKTIERLEENYGSKAKDIRVYIGPHIGGCCYEVSPELIEAFTSEDIYSNIKISNNNKLDLEKCILAQLVDKGIKEENITTTHTCTACNKQYELYSYRNSENKQGRMFSFVYLTTQEMI
ncbi:peptidoglycan editing factor PgeF [Clostridium sp. FP2]|uniref:peptidoglycan editing factor PgeF n=1 Tax=Clostridium TaxID=1485 RepID=UPI0013E95AB5|nr:MULTISPECIES: peptidoglycan editing factor PgeF [Clostridium]MBW9155959.1 peptidoglycan editing factor PgeF [Clostridium tagluense]MBZ9624117.1 peptidoglycan editing factor PgeF [Clostridium sp. FP2]MCB2298397.1 peptidoglycan editing factor PgeF [Clostridium tagluense]WLC64007.1 peptidoglycan editing factor PgeF [Clostridium tagluense]